MEYKIVIIVNDENKHVEIIELTDIECIYEGDKILPISELKKYKDYDLIYSNYYIKVSEYLKKYNDYEEFTK